MIKLFYREYIFKRYFTKFRQNREGQNESLPPQPIRLFGQRKRGIFKYYSYITSNIIFTV